MFERKNRVIKLNLDNTYDEKMKECSGGKIDWDDKKQVDFEPKAVFVPKKQGRIFKKANLIFFGERCVEAYKFGKKTKGLQTHWTEEEATRVQDKELAKSLEQQKPMTWNQVILLAIPILINVVISFVLLNKLGIV